MNIYHGVSLQCISHTLFRSLFKGIPMFLSLLHSFMFISLYLMNLLKAFLYELKVIPDRCTSSSNNICHIFSSLPTLNLLLVVPIHHYKIVSYTFRLNLFVENLILIFSLHWQIFLVFVLIIFHHLMFIIEVQSFYLLRQASVFIQVLCVGRLTLRP